MLYATATDENKKTVYSRERIYMPQCGNSLGQVMVLGPDKKLGIIRDTTFQPWATKREVFDIQLNKPARRLKLNLRLVYRLRPGDEIPVHDWTRTVDVAGLFPQAAH
ncbi:MAG: hypothetical protein K9K66_13785 [Desulfarculaceae bacterium]|nr:hypothetical protein [Desulfarculaceae bacterium]MCF8074438.1 hypothetical protein [Desulfarculaceae bacterium]MCF8102722.1 hypothetical protein [Desulfarculaceae bacterium]MCF8116423.1 hypothetical protein [Desulfarculaceae bacterium]